MGLLSGAFLFFDGFGEVGVIFFKGALEGGLGGDDDIDTVACDEFQVVDGVDVRGVDHGDDEGVSDAAHGDGHVLLNKFAGEQRQDFGFEFKVIEIDGRHAILLAEPIFHLFFVKRPCFHEVLAVASHPAAFLLEVLRLSDLCG